MKKLFLAAIAAVVFLVGCGKDAPAPVHITATAPAPVDQKMVDAAVAKALPAAVRAELTRREKAEAEAAELAAQAKEDSLAQVVAEKAAKELAAMPARVRKLEKELAALKAASAATVHTTAPVVLQPQATNLPAAIPPVPAAMDSTKTFEVKVEVSQPIEKWGLAVGPAGWTEFKPGECGLLVPGEYLVNARADNGVWAWDSVSLQTGHPNFTVKVNGVEIPGPGTTNGLGGANGRFRLNPDGSVTPL